jgi:hypothetical protein
MDLSSWRLGSHQRLQASRLQSGSVAEIAGAVGDSSDSIMVLGFFGADNFGGDAYGCFSWGNV